MKTYSDAVKIIACIKREDIAYVCGTVESYDDFAIVRTLDAQKGIIEFLVSPYFMNEMNGLLKELNKEIELKIHC